MHYMKTSEKKVLLTGGTGLIGKEAVEPLLASGFDVHLVSTKQRGELEGLVKTVEADLLDLASISHIFRKVKPDYLLHFAWIASGDYLVSPDNFKWLASSMEMLKALKENGGKRAVFAGTCFEYEFKEQALKENDKLNPSTIYAQCKAGLYRQAREYSLQSDLSFGWGRIFYVLGHGEFEKRLVPSVISSLKKGQHVSVSRGLERDYMYTRDVAAAFVKFLDSDVQGAVNICRGEGVLIEELARSLARKLGREDLVDTLEPVGQPPIIVGDNTRLFREVGYRCRFSLAEALERVYAGYFGENSM